MVSKRQYDDVLGYIKIGKKEGAKSESKPAADTKPKAKKAD